MKIITFMITLVLVTAGIAFGLMTFFVDLSSTTGLNVNSTSYNESFLAMNDMINLTQDIQDDIESGDYSGGSADIVILGPKAVYKAVKGAFNSVGVFIKMVSTAGAETIDVPSWVFDIIITTIILLFLGALIYAFIGRDV